MAAAARPGTRPPTSDTARATLPLRRSLRPSPERRPGGPARPGPAPPRPRHGAAKRARGTRVGNRIRSIRTDLLVDRLLRGRLWVALIALLLTGIVFLNVALLEVNGSIARMDARAAELRRDNSALRMRVARLGSSERIQRSAADRGFTATPPGEVGYLVSRPGDAAAAARALERWPERRPSAVAAGAGERATAPVATTDASGSASTATAAGTAGPSEGAGDSAAVGIDDHGEAGALTP
jgi:cell division protein FtsL